MTSRFRKFAVALYWAITAAIALRVLSVLVCFVLPDFARSILMGSAPRGLLIQAEPSNTVVYWLLLVGLVPIAVQLFVMWQTRSLLWLYGQGDALSRACGWRISRMGLGVLVLPLANIAYGTAASALLTLGNAAGERQLSIGISGPDMTALIGGGLLLLIGAAMLEASRAADENRSFV